MGSKVAATVLELGAMAAKYLDTNEDEEDAAILKEILRCSDIAFTSERKKRKWVSEWRQIKHPRITSPPEIFEKAIQDPPPNCDFFDNIETFNLLLSFIEKDIKKNNTLMRRTITSAEKLIAVLDFLATGDSYVAVNYRTKISTSYLCKAVPDICEAIWQNLKDHYMKFPNTEREWMQISNDFEGKWKFPNCLGVLDGKQLSAKTTRKSDNIGKYSVDFLGFVDANCRFIHVDIAMTPELENEDMYARSDFKLLIDNPAINLPLARMIGGGIKLPYVAVASDIFSLEQRIMKAYPAQTKCSQEQIFNSRLSQTKKVVDHAMGMLFEKFKVLQTQINLGLETVEKIVLACCVLHNFMLEHDEFYGCNYTPMSTEPQESYEFPQNVVAEQIRRNFAEFFEYEGQFDDEIE